MAENGRIPASEFGSWKADLQIKVTYSDVCHLNVALRKEMEIHRRRK